MADKFHEWWDKAGYTAKHLCVYEDIKKAWYAGKKEVFDDIDKNKKISGYILEPEKKLIHMSRRIYEELKLKHLQTQAK